MHATTRRRHATTSGYAHAASGRSWCGGVGAGKLADASGRAIAGADEYIAATAAKGGTTGAGVQAQHAASAARARSITCRQLQRTAGERAAARRSGDVAGGARSGVAGGEDQATCAAPSPCTACADADAAAPHQRRCRCRCGDDY